MLCVNDGSSSPKAAGAWRILRYTLAVLAVALPLVAPADVFEGATDRPGSYFRDFPLERGGPRMCRQVCERTQGCAAFTWVRPRPPDGLAHCWLKSDVPPARRDDCCVSGIVREAVASGDAGAPPQIARVYPPEGPGHGGTTVVIVGSGFLGATSVTFGGANSHDFRVVSDNKVIAVVPPLANWQTITSGYQVDAAVCTPAGCSPQYVPGNFTYMP